LDKEKNMAGIKKNIEETEVVEEQVEQESGIIVRDPEAFRPVDLPLVVTLPNNASKAQIEYAKVLNAYAYSNPEKWKEKKDTKVLDGRTVLGLIAKLEALKNAPDPVQENVRLTVGTPNRLS